MVFDYWSTRKIYVSPYHCSQLDLTVGNKEAKAKSDIAQSCRTLCDPMDCSLPGSLSPWNFPGKSTGVGCHFLLQEIFLTQGLNPGLPRCRKTLYHRGHQDYLQIWLDYIPWVQLCLYWQSLFPECTCFRKTMWVSEKPQDKLCTLLHSCCQWCRGKTGSMPIREEMNRMFYQHKRTTFCFLLSWPLHLFSSCFTIIFILHSLFCCSQY